MSYIEIINIYILLFLQNNRETLCLIFFADKQKTNYCKIVKSLSLLCLGTFLGPISHCFFLAGIVHSRREKIDCSENLKVWTSIWVDSDIRVASYLFIVFGWLFKTHNFPGQTVVVQQIVLFTTASLFFLSMSNVKIWRKFGKIRP